MFRAVFKVFVYLIIFTVILFIGKLTPFVLTMYAEYNHKQDNFDKAIFYYQKALDITENVWSKNKEKIAEANRKLGEAYYFAKKHKEAVDCFKKVGSVIESEKYSPEEKFLFYIEFATSYHVLKKDDDAILLMDKIDEKIQILEKEWSSRKESIELLRSSINARQKHLKDSENNSSG
jgi:tetratricopeptide (TPR) repeat protein